MSADLPFPPMPDPAATSLFLDVDGTLVPIAERPDAVRVDPALPPLLDRLAIAMPGRVALVSGRSVAQLDAMLGPAAGTLTVAASHGAERRLAGGAIERPERPAALEAAAAEFNAFAELNGLVFEAKTLGAALHYRLCPEWEKEASVLAEQVARQHGLTLQRGKMMVEVRLPGDKGGAIRALMAEEAAAGTSPWFLGDDVTDEDGFAAAAALGGAGILVGPPRATAASYVLQDVAAVHDWLRDLADGVA